MKIFKIICVLLACCLMTPAMSSQVATGSKVTMKSPSLLESKNSFKPGLRFSLHKKHKALLQSETIKLALALQELALTANAVDYSGRGNVDYWMRTTVDFIYVAWGLGKGISVISEGMANGHAKTMLKTTANHLLSMDAGSRGNVDYWMNRAREVAESIRADAEQVISLSYTLDEQSSVARYIDAFTEVINVLDYSGRGDVDYWMRITNDIVALGNVSGISIANVAMQTSPQLAQILDSYANRLKNMSAAGRGNVNYWMNKAKARGDELGDIAQALYKISLDL